MRINIYRGMRKLNKCDKREERINVTDFPGLWHGCVHCVCRVQRGKLRVFVCPCVCLSVRDRLGTREGGVQEGLLFRVQLQVRCAMIRLGIQLFEVHVCGA